MLLKSQKGLSISMKERLFLRQDSSTRGVRRTMTTGVISSNSILPSGVFTGSMPSKLLSGSLAELTQILFRSDLLILFSASDARGEGGSWLA